MGIKDIIAHDHSNVFRMIPHPQEHQTRFTNIGFEDFRAMARDGSLSLYEKIGFPDAYRSGKEQLIFADICAKLPAFEKNDSRILDIGCGCSDLPRIIIDNGTTKNQHLVLIDSEEMLAHVPTASNVCKIAARFPDCPALFDKYADAFDSILTYSVIQYVFAEGNVFAFLDQSLKLLAPQGRMLIGDIPNISMRKRFFASATGEQHHRDFTGTDEKPAVTFNTLEDKNIDDSVVLALLGRARLAGFHAFVVPQAPGLPMANRREDILIIRP